MKLRLVVEGPFRGRMTIGASHRFGPTGAREGDSMSILPIHYYSDTGLRLYRGAR